MDVLSEVLRVIRLTGAVHFCANLTAPWSFISSLPEMLAARLVPGAESITPFHVGVHGNCLVSWGKHPPIPFGPGDVVIFARGVQHVFASDPGLAPVPVKDVYKPSADQIAVVNYGGGGKESRFICGYLHSDQLFSPLLDAMPAVVFVRVRNGTPVVETFTETEAYAEPVTLKHDALWWQASIDRLIVEATRPGQGNRAVLARLSELLFMEVVRWQLSYISKGHGGWLAGLNDPQVGGALTLLHANPERPWTVEELAQQVASSRAALAKRFVDLVGETPIQYLAGWRMHLARRLLRESALSLAQIGSRVGYESEAAFNRAFRRVVGTPPAAWRQSKVQGAQLRQRRAAGTSIHPRLGSEKHDLRRIVDESGQVR
jgi:AraC-like DNA-binding protein